MSSVRIWTRTVFILAGVKSQTWGGFGILPLVIFTFFPSQNILSQQSQATKSHREISAYPRSICCAVFLQAELFICEVSRTGLAIFRRFFEELGLKVLEKQV